MAPASMPAAIVTPFITEPGSYAVLTAGLTNDASDALLYRFGSNDGRLASAMIAPVCGSMTITVPPLAPVCAMASARPCSNGGTVIVMDRSEEHTSELQSLRHLVCRLLLEKK